MANLLISDILLQLSLLAHFHDLRNNLANLVVIYGFLVVVAVLVGGGESVQRKSA